MSRSVLLSLLLAVPALAAPEEPYLKNARPLTTAAEFQKAGESYFSPDGKRILFQAVPVGAAAPWYQIWVMDADGGNKRLVSTGKGKTTCAWFHPGDPNKFIYASTHLDPSTHGPPAQQPQGRSYQWDYDATFDVFEADLRTGEVLRRLTDAHGYDAECSMSQDGKRICFTSRRIGGEESDIWIMNADGSDQRALVRVDGTDGGPFFSPDDKWVLYRAARGGNENVMQVFLTSVDGKETKQLTDARRINWAPFFHPKGEVIAFSANPVGHEFEVILVKADGSRRELALTATEGFDGLPTFSRDGTKMIWTSNRTGTSQVWIADFVMPPDSAFVAPPSPPAPKPPVATDPHAAPRTDPHAASPDPHAPAPTGPTATIQPRTGSAAAAAAPAMAAIDRQGLLADIRWLADDAREGRRAGTPGSRSAAAWLAHRFAELGLEPGAKNGTYWQPFEFSQGARRAAEGNALSLGTNALELDREWVPLLYSKSGAVKGQLVFAGFGIRAPDKGWDDLAKLDLTGKIALVLTGGPKDEQGGAFGEKHPTVWDDLRYKVANCRDAGAIGVILVRTKGQGWLRLEAGEPGILVAQVDAAALKARTQFDAPGVASHISAHGGGAGAWNGPMPGAVDLQVSIERVRGRTENVIARIEGRDRLDEVVVIGAHYDHLGRGGEGSLAPESGDIHNGADDNASGTSGVLALARAFRAHPPRRTLLFVAFGAEEEGLIGSQRFVEDPPTRIEQVVAMLNMDMIGRLDGRALVVGGAGTAREWPGLLQTAADEAGQAITPQQDGLGPSDHASFYKANVPVLFLFSGSHPDYHKPTDDVDRLDLPGAERAARVAYSLVRAIDALPARPTFQKVTRSDAPARMVVTGEQGAYFGSIPDYNWEGEGVKLSGAKAGGPADKAGVKAGDVVVEFAGRRVVTMADYMAGLRLCAPGQTIEVVVLREGQRVKLSATLTGK